jgi:caffeoyl-CoA O-methyltransferase
MDLIPETVRTVMAELEARNRADGVEGTPQEARLRSISPEVGQFLLTLALSIGAKSIVEIGTSGGYSTLWLAVAASRNGGRVTTFEIDGAKAALARRTFSRAGLGAFVELREGDARAGVAALDGAADMIFIDAEKRDYVTYLELALRILRPGGLLVADNLISHAAELVEFRARALAEPRLTGLVVPIGSGELVAVRLP